MVQSLNALFWTIVIGRKLHFGIRVDDNVGDACALTRVINGLHFVAEIGIKCSESHKSIEVVNQPAQRRNPFSAHFIEFNFVENSNLHGWPIVCVPSTTFRFKYKKDASCGVEMIFKWHGRHVLGPQTVRRSIRVLLWNVFFFFWELICILPRRVMAQGRLKLIKVFLVTLTLAMVAAEGKFRKLRHLSTVIDAALHRIFPIPAERYSDEDSNYGKTWMYFPDGDGNPQVANLTEPPNSNGRARTGEPRDKVRFELYTR